MEREVKAADFGGPKPRFVEVNCGKAVTVRESPQRMIELIEETNLQINVLNIT